MTDDAFLGGALRILQPRDGYRAGLDAVLLAAGRGRGRQARSGCSTWAPASAWSAWRWRAASPMREVALVERDAALAELARAQYRAQRSVASACASSRPTWSGRCASQPALAALAESFDHVLANPPYHTQGRGTAAADATKAAANAMAGGQPGPLGALLAAMARPTGAAAVIHRPRRWPTLLAACDGRFGGARGPAHPPAAGREPAIRVIVHGIKGSRAPLESAAGARAARR